MKPWMPFQIQSVRSWEELRRFTDQSLQNLFTLMSGNVNFQDNIQCSIAESVVLSPAGTTIPHNLNKIPYGFLVLNQNASASIYGSTLPWTNTNIYLASSATVTAKIAILGG